MLKRCIAAGCSTSNGEGYTRGFSLHAFLCYERSGERANCLSSMFKAFCFALEGSSYRDTVGIPAKKRLKPETLPTSYFPKPKW